MFHNPLIPKTTLDRYSLLALSSFVLFFVSSQAVRIMTTPKDGTGLFNDLPYAGLLIVVCLCGAATLFTAIASMIKRRGRALPVLISAFIGLFALFFWLGQALSTH